MTKLAEDLRARAVTGEDFLKLQKEAFEAAGMKIESPTVTLPSIRRSGLPPAHTAVFALKPGDVSQVISDNGGHYIYKMNNKSEMTLDQAKTEIHGKLQNDRMHEEMDKLNNSFKVETNEAYFGPGGVGTAPPSHLPRPRQVTPAAPGAQPQTAPPAEPIGVRVVVAERGRSSPLPHHAAGIEVYFPDGCSGGFQDPAVPLLAPLRVMLRIPEDF